MNRKINITNTTQESTNHLRQVPLFLEDRPDTHLATYAENVYIGGRKALTEGKFHDMFLAGDGHELEDYTDENGKQRIAHARSIYSSSMLAYNFFHWISPERPLTLNGTTYDKVYFEVKFPIFTKSTEGRPVNRPSNMDVVLISEDCLTMLCIESKYTEHTHHQTAIFSDAYITPSCYYKGNPYCATFQRLAMCYNEKSNGYFAGIKQNVSHLIGITNVMHDDKALAWFKANNPYIEPEVLAQISHNTEFIFTNLLYCRPEDVDDFFGDLQAEEHPYPYLLAELLFDDLQKNLDEPLLLSSFIKTYPELFAEVQSQMQKPLADYLDNRYVLTPQPHFALPEGYDTADHYLIDVVMEGARKRYKNHYSDEVSARIKSELKAIRVRHWADRFLIMWDLMRELHQNRFCTTPGGNRTAGSVVAYCLGITDVEPLGANLSEAGMFYRPTFPDLFIELSKPGTAFADQYTQEKYGDLASKIVYRYYYIMDIVEQTIANLDIDINFSAIPYDSPELLRFFMNDDNWRQYTYFGQCDMDRLRGLDNPTLEDMVYIFGDRPFENGKHVTINREHCYGRCVLFLRTAWLKMHFPETFNKVADARFKPGNYHQLIVAGLKEDEIESEVISSMVSIGSKGTPVALFTKKGNKETTAHILKTFSSEELRDKPIYLDDTQNLTITELRSRLNSLYKEHDVKLVYIEDFNDIEIDLPNYDTIKRLCAKEAMFEDIVLGTIMCERDAYDEVADFLHPEVFEKPQNRLVYDAIYQLAKKKQPKFIDSVAERMKLDGTLDQVGGMEYLVELTRHISSTRQLRTYAQIMAVKVCLSK
ncbi:MAG: hypothetical protein II644_07995 [Paludibacteraceae bacterium]|nr:hypothetical protein [Paludibacteraceae bacterium]